MLITTECIKLSECGITDQTWRTCALLNHNSKLFEQGQSYGKIPYEKYLKLIMHHYLHSIVWADWMEWLNYVCLSIEFLYLNKFLFFTFHYETKTIIFILFVKLLYKRKIALAMNCVCVYGYRNCKNNSIQTPAVRQFYYM